MEPITTYGARSIANLVAMNVTLAVIVVVTGVLLSFWYVPSSQPARTRDGANLTIVTQLRIDTVGRFVDTLRASPSMPRLAPQRSGEVVPSMAQASIRVDISRAPFGAIVRSLHRWISDVLLITAALLVLALAGFKAYELPSGAWKRSLLLLGCILLGGWTGRILVDDVYAEISRRIMGHELSEAPFGGFLVAILGIEPSAAHLARTYSVHAIVLGIGGVLLVSRELRSCLQDVHWLWVGGVTIGVSVVAGVVAVPEYGLRDAIQGLLGSVSVRPWWGIVPFRSWVQWLGAELAGYVLLGTLMALFLLPHWHHSTTPRTVRLVMLSIALALLAGALFGN
ncbi:MAG: hypothetical protein RL594_619 [Bacteroidota bacterium]|jgi:quinol-cytochrome oxidoreductase complex cytochrome b subunit